MFNFYWIFIAVGKIPYYFNKAYPEELDDQGDYKIKPATFKDCCTIVACYPIFTLFQIILMINFPGADSDLRIIDNITYALLALVFFLTIQELYKLIMARREQGDPSRSISDQAS